MINTENAWENKKVFAGFFVRFIAYMIDSLIAGIAVGMITIPLRIMSGSVDFLSANFLFRFTVIDVISYVGVAAYFVLLTYYAHTTLGKMLMHLEVISKKDEWSIINIIYRETVGRFLSSIGYIGYLATLVTKEKQGFHDMLCDTCVVYKGMEPSRKNVVFVTPVEEAVEKPSVTSPESLDYNSMVEPVLETEAGMPVTENMGEVSDVEHNRNNVVTSYHVENPETVNKVNPPTYH